MSPAAKADVSAAGRRRWLCNPWLPALVGVLCFANSLFNDFTYDDRPLILDNPRVQSLTDVRAIWLTDWWKGLEDRPGFGESRDRLYRPLTLFTLALNYAVNQHNPPGYHLVNVLLHGAACAMVWLLARRLLGGPWVANCAALLFAVHPVHAEAVANVVGRAEILATVCLLGGLLALLPRRRRVGIEHVALAAALFFGALLAKETAICYPVLAGAAAFRWRPRVSVGRMLAYGAVLLIPLAAYFPMRYAALDGTLFRAEPADVLMNPLVGSPAAARVGGALTVLGLNARLLAAPGKLSADYGYAIVDPENVFGGAMVVGSVSVVAAAIALCGFAQRGRTWRRFAVLTAMFVGSYALISNTVLLIGVAVAERLLYWPSVVAVMLAALGIRKGLDRYLWAEGNVQRRRLVAILGVGLLAALGVRAAVRSADWANNLTLFTRDVETYPEGVYLHKSCAAALVEFWREKPGEDDPRWPAAADHLLGLEMWHAGWPVEQRKRAVLVAAEKHFGEALAIHATYAEALAGRGQVRAQLGDYAGARVDLDAALYLKPRHRDARRALDQLNRVERGTALDAAGIEALRRTVAASPGDVEAAVRLGGALLDRTELDEARAVMQRAAEVSPEDSAVLRLLARVLMLLEEDGEAARALERLVAVSPEDWEAHTNLSALLQETDPAGALRYAERAYALHKEDLRVLVNLAGAYERNGRDGEALEMYRRIERGLGAEHPLRGAILKRIEKLGGSSE